MTRQQGLTIAIIALLLLLAGGRFWLFSTLKNTPQDLTTNIQPELSTGTTQTTTGAIVSSGITPKENTSSPLPLTATGTTGAITILLPPRFAPAARDELSKSMRTVSTQEAKVFQPKTLAAYLKALVIMSTGSRQVDIMLVPRNETSHLAGRGLVVPRQNSPAPRLHPQLGSLLEDPDLTFFPYAIDPRVTLLKSPKPIPSLTLASFLQEMTLQKHLLPLGIQSQTLDQLEQHQDPYVRFSRLLQIWLDQLADVDSPETLSLLLRVQSPQPATCFDTVSCLVSSDELHGLRLPVSQFEQEGVPGASLNVSNFPSLTSQAPADVRGWVINNQSPQLTASAARVQAYLKLLIDDQLPYHDRMLPVLHSRFQRLLLQPQRQRLTPIAYRLERLGIPTTITRTSLEKTPFLELLEGNYNPAIFLTTWEKAREGQKE